MADVQLSKTDKRIYALLRDSGDVPQVVYIVGDDNSSSSSANNVHGNDGSVAVLRVRRHGRAKRVLLVATQLHTYIVKRKGYKLYTHYANRHLSVHARDATVTLRRDNDDDAEDKDCSRRVLPNDSVNNNNSSSSIFRDANAPAAAAVGTMLSSSSSPWPSVVLLTSSAYVANDIEQQLTQLSRATRRMAELLAAQEQRGSGSDDDEDSGDGGSSASDDDSRSSKDSDDDDDTETSDVGDAATRLQRRLTWQTSNDVVDDNDNNNVGVNGGSSSMAPSRYTALSSLVDAEFADYTTLKNAYLRHEEDALLQDLNAFIADKESRVAALCAQHYATFTHAAQQCLAISAHDAALVRAELSGAAAVVRGCVLRLRRVVAALLRSRSTHASLLHVRTLLTRTRGIVEHLEAAEAHMRRQQLSAALASLRALVRVAAPLTEYAVGGYALHVRVPRLLVDAFTHAVRRLHAWLRQLREAAPAVGAAALQWPGVVRAGATRRQLRHSAEGCTWRVTRSWRGAALRAGPFAAAAVVSRVCSGAAVQRVFYELRQGDYFHAYYNEGRRLQASTDLFSTATTTAATTTATTTATPQETRVGDDAARLLVDGFASYCAMALGFVLLEDVVFHATAPHAQSTADVLRLWDGVAQHVAQRARDAAAALPLATADDTTHLTRLFHTVQALAHCATTSVRCVELSPLVLSRAVEALRDRLVSWRLSEACAVCAQALLTPDAAAAARVHSASEFDAQVARFGLHRCGRAVLDLPIPTHYTTSTAHNNSSSGEEENVLTLPYCAWVPRVGECVLSFLSHCFRVTDLDRSAALLPSELNNTDDMILKYIAVLFRTVSETLQSQLLMLSSMALSAAQAKSSSSSSSSSSATTSSVVPAALFVSSCACMPVLVSCAEQQFMLHWQGDTDDDDDDDDDDDMDDDMDDELYKNDTSSRTDSNNNSSTATRQVMGVPRLLSSTAALFARPLQAGIDCVLQAYRAEMEQRLRGASAFSYWQRQLVLRAAADKTTAVVNNNNNNSTATTGATTFVYSARDNAFVAAMNYAIDTIPQLLRILQPTVVRGVVGTGIAHASMLMQSSIETALSDAGKVLTSSSGGNSSSSLLQAMYACVHEFELQCEQLVPQWQRRLSAALDGLSAAQRFPLHASSTADDLRAWLRKREAQLAAQQSQPERDAAAAAQQLLRSGFEEAGKAVVRGFTVVGKTVAGNTRRDKA